MDTIIIIMLIVCCCCCCIILGGGGYYYITTQSSTQNSTNNTSLPVTDKNTSLPVTDKKTSLPVTDNNTSVQPTTPIPTTTSNPSTTLKPTTTPIPKGLTIYSDLNFQGSSLFIPTGTYDKSFFDKNWTDLGIRSWKSPNNDILYITFFGSGGFSGGSVNVNANNTGAMFGNWDYIMKGITEFNIYTPEQFKAKFCKGKAPGTRWSTNWNETIVPSSNC